MSEFWVSKQRYFCKYCKVYIADDAPSRQHHEGGLRHKGNLERFIRGIYKTGEKRAKDAAEEQREIARIEQVAQAAFAQDVGAGRARHTTSTSTTLARAGPSKPIAKTGNSFSNYSTAESLGFSDPDAERDAAENERRQMEGTVGDWQVVEAVIPAPGHDAQPEEVAEENAAIGVKRPLPQDDDDNTREFKLRKKSLGNQAEETSTSSGTSASQPSTQKWIKKEWSAAEPEELVKEEELTLAKEEVKPTVAVEDAPHSTPTFFKKRRPAGNRTAGRREL
ncbi:hypothetical protein DL96DRAFT_1602749 [Flagelloscypha sp. PMI_526]|nr:hypothetical protein DL96DRAFT_1602749 [Flagelloscypha sp. PMI_526]